MQSIVNPCGWCGTLLIQAVCIIISRLCMEEQSLFQRHHHAQMFQYINKKGILVQMRA
jgi:hypothetical protein